MADSVVFRVLASDRRNLAAGATFDVVDDRLKRASTLEQRRTAHGCGKARSESSAECLDAIFRHV